MPQEVHWKIYLGPYLEVELLCPVPVDLIRRGVAPPIPDVLIVGGAKRGAAVNSIAYLGVKEVFVTSAL